VTEPQRPMRTRGTRPPGFAAAPADAAANPKSHRTIGRQDARVPSEPDPAPDLHDARTRTVFVRAPDPLPRWLELVLVDVHEARPKATRQDIICALMLRYVRPADPAALQHIIDMLDDLEHARRRR
jgi:hypothetical protein